MWTIIYTAQDRMTIEDLCNALRNVKILFRIITASGENKFDVLVPSTEVEQAHNVLIDMTV